MTQSEWLTCTDPQQMLEFLCGKVSDRKLRLFAVACCRKNWCWFTDPASQNAVLVAEGYADGKLTQRELINSQEIAYRVQRLDRQQNFHDRHFIGKKLAAIVSISQDTLLAAKGVVNDTVFAAGACFANEEMSTDLKWESEWLVAIRREQEELACLLRDIVYPFHHISTWLSRFTTSVSNMAHSIYVNRTFEHLPILADALEDAGCTDSELLKHLRSDGLHVRGCWALDDVLGKE